MVLILSFVAFLIAIDINIAAMLAAIVKLPPVCVAHNPVTMSLTG